MLLLHMPIAQKGERGQMQAPLDGHQLVAAFPLSNTRIVVICGQPLHASMAQTHLFSLRSGLTVRNVEIDVAQPQRVFLDVEPMETNPLVVDEVIISSLRSADGSSLGRVTSPLFIQAIQTPMELRVPHFKDAFPYVSIHTGVHVSLMCCTGCNGGIHDRAWSFSTTIQEAVGVVYGYGQTRLFRLLIHAGSALSLPVVSSKKTMVPWRLLTGDGW